MVHPKFEAVYEQGETLNDLTERNASVVTEIGRRAASAPLDADSLLLKYLGSNKNAFPGFATGTLQLMKPSLGQGVTDHSDFFNDELGRIDRSLPWIYGSAYDENAAETGNAVREFHRNIKGTDEHGKRYHAWNPDTWHWAHATFVRQAFVVATKYSKGNFTQRDREQMYDESRTWYQNWGISDSPVPETYKGFREYWDHMCQDELELTPAATRAIMQAMGRKAPRPSFIPEEIWPWLEVPLMPVTDHLGLLTIGELPQQVRDRFHIPFSNIDKIRLNMVRTAVRQLDHLPIPDKVMYHPRAYEGLQRLKREKQKHPSGHAA